MGQVIRVAFGTEREWEETYQTVIDGLVLIGALFGDEESMMRAKAKCVYSVLRSIIDQVPSIKINAPIPPGLLPEQLEVLKAGIKEAALRGIETAMTHSVEVLMGSIYDLCTSKLADAKHPVN
jgi:hypothetical protein